MSQPQLVQFAEFLSQCIKSIKTFKNAHFNVLVLTCTINKIPFLMF
jgi:hypothetical protein